MSATKATLGLLLMLSGFLCGMAYSVERDWLWLWLFGWAWLSFVLDRRR